MKKSFLFSALGIALAIAMVTVSNLTAQAPADVQAAAKQQRVFVVQAGGKVNEVSGTARKLLEDGWTIADLVGSGNGNQSSYTACGIIVLEK